MPVKLYKSTKGGRRNSSVDTFEDISVTEPYKKLITIKKRSGGRNVYGRITVRHIGGGAKRFIRIIDFKRDKYDMEGVVTTIEYDPNRNARIGLISYADGEKRYIITPTELKIGDKIVSSRNNKIEIKPGNAMTLKDIPVGSMIYNIELTPGKGGQIVRSAGCSAQLMALEEDYALIKLPSSEIRKVLQSCMATIGTASNPESMTIVIGKAGRKRHMGIKPTVRGKVMNPVDHPHGGGEGKHPIGMKYPKTPWGKHALGVKTRKVKKYSDSFIVSRRKKKN